MSGPLAQTRLGRALLVAWAVTVLALFLATARLPGPPLSRALARLHAFAAQ